MTGSWAQNDVLPYVSGLQLLLSGLVLTAVAALILVAHRYARRAVLQMAAAEPRPEAPSPILRLALGQARAPFLVGMAIVGCYGAFSILVFRFEVYADVLLDFLGWIKTAGLAIDLFWFLFRLIRVFEQAMVPWSRQMGNKWEYILLTVGARAARLILPLIAGLLIVPTLDIPERFHAALQEAMSVVLIAAIGVIFCDLANTVERSIQAQYKVDVADNLATRKIQTQVGILKKIFVALVVLVTLACMLTVFAPVRSVGSSILASAGVAGIVLGIAAQRSLGTLLAGIQIAFSQPIRLDDVVIVEGEWGRIEEITLTYVVVAIWDLRRMVLPITYFIEKPFQNWTRSNAALLGTVFLYLDYTTPVDALRTELERILEQSTLWDRKVKGLQVTDARDNTIEVRILASAANSGASFDLRCEIREKMIDFLQRNHPGSLPRSRGALVLTRTDPSAAKTPAGRTPRATAPHVLTVAQGLASPVTVNQGPKPESEDTVPGLDLGGPPLAD